MGTRRLGDQLGAMLAGAYSLRSDGLCSPQEAEEWLEAQDWGDTAKTDEKDEERLLATLMAHRIRVQTIQETSPGHPVTVTLDMTLERLVGAAVGYDAAIPSALAAAELRNYGMRTMTPEGNVVPTHLLVSTNHPALAKILSDTPWQRQWSRALLRLTGAEVPAKVWRFGLGIVGRATQIPLATIDVGDSTIDVGDSAICNTGKTPGVAALFSCTGSGEPDSSYV